MVPDRVHALARIIRFKQEHISILIATVRFLSYNSSLPTSITTIKSHVQGQHPLGLSLPKYSSLDLSSGVCALFAVFIHII